MKKDISIYIIIKDQNSLETFVFFTKIDPTTMRLFIKKNCHGNSMDFLHFKYKLTRFLFPLRNDGGWKKSFSMDLMKAISLGLSKDAS